MKLREARTLMIGDSRELCSLVESVCEQEGFFHVETAFSCREVEEWIENRAADFLILDVNVLSEDKFSFSQRIRTVLEKQRTPVLFFSARDQNEDRFQGSDLGADDYMTKSSLLKELVLRISAVLKWTYRLEEQTECYRLGKREVGSFAGAVGLLDESERTTSLASEEYQPSRLFLENRGRIPTSGVLSESVWEESYFDYKNTLMVHVRKLREEIEEKSSRPEFLIAVKGLEYRVSR